MNNEPIMGSIQNNIKIQRNETSCLFLFTPKNVGNHFVRPLSYNFNQTLVHDIYDSVINNKSPKLAINSHSANRSIVPSSNGIGINTSVLSNYWSFVLIVDTENDHAGQSVRENMMPTRFANMRFIYSGYCSDDPVSRNSINLPTPIMNNQCVLRITRKVIINKLKQRINGGGIKMRDNVIDDIIVAKYDKRMAGNKPLFSLSPKSALSSVFTQDENNNVDHMSVLSTDDSLNVRDSIKHQSSLQSPKSHLASIVTSIKRGVEDITYQGNTGAYEQNHRNDLFTEVDDTGNYLNEIVLNNVEADLSYKHEISDMDNGNIFGLDSAYDLYIQDVMSKYDPDIYIIKNQNKSLSIIPQDYLSIETVFSSLVSSCIPSFAINANLSSVAFGYDSFRDAIEVFHFDSPASCSQEDLISKWNVFIYLFKNELVPIIKENGGEFHLLVNCSTSNSTISKLQFYDNGNVFGKEDYYEHSNIPGGLNSNTLGTAGALSKNGVMINNLVKNVTDLSLSGMDYY